MKKILLTILLAIILLPLPAVAQTWVEPFMQPDGTMTPGQWSTKADDWQKSFSSPGTMNPFTGQFNSYGRKNPLPSSALPRIIPPLPFQVIVTQNLIPFQALMPPIPILFRAPMPPIPMLLWVPIQIIKLSKGRAPGTQT